jgi:drug/metabolite transporter (DMT)-like permease
MTENRKKGAILVLITAFISGFAIFINKFGVKGVDPFFYTYVKNVMAGAVLVSILFLFKEKKELLSLKRQDKKKLFFVALVGGAIPFLLFFKGLSMTEAVKAGFIHKTMFLYVGVMATFFLKEKVNKTMLLGLVSLFAGSILFLKIKPQALAIGDLYILIATLLWAVEIIISKKVLKNVTGTLVGTVRLFGGSLFILAFLLLTGRAELFSTMNFEIVKWGIISGFILACYNWSFYNGLKHIKAIEASVILTLGAPVTAILSLVFLNNTITGLQLVGIGLIILGIVLVSTVVQELLKLNKFFNKEKINELS